MGVKWAVSLFGKLVNYGTSTFQYESLFLAQIKAFLRKIKRIDSLDLINHIGLFNTLCISRLKQLRCEVCWASTRSNFSTAPLPNRPKPQQRPL